MLRHALILSAVAAVLLFRCSPKDDKKKDDSTESGLPGDGTGTGTGSGSGSGSDTGSGTTTDPEEDKKAHERLARLIEALNAYDQSPSPKFLANGSNIFTEPCTEGLADVKNVKTGAESYDRVYEFKNCVLTLDAGTVKLAGELVVLREIAGSSRFVADALAIDGTSCAIKAKTLSTVPYGEICGLHFDGPEPDAPPIPTFAAAKAQVIAGLPLKANDYAPLTGTWLAISSVLSISTMEFKPDGVLLVSRRKQDVDEWETSLFRILHTDTYFYAVRGTRADGAIKIDILRTKTRTEAGSAEGAAEIAGGIMAPCGKTDWVAGDVVECRQFVDYVDFGLITIDPATGQLRFDEYAGTAEEREVEDLPASSISSYTKVLPAAASGTPVNVAAVKNAFVDITWDKVDGAVAYAVFSSRETPVTFTNSKETFLTVSSLNDPNQPSDIYQSSATGMHYFRVLAVFPTGNSALSAEASVSL